MLKKKNNLYTFEKFNNFPKLTAEFSTRAYNFTTDDLFSKNRTAQDFARDAVFDLDHTICMEQVHGARIKSVGIKEAGTIICDTDGLITQDKNINLLIRTADCAPILFLDTRRQVIGIAHSGWRGTLLGISELMINKFKLDYKSDPKDIIVGIGPMIGICCYDIPKERLDKFSSAFPDDTSYYEVREGAYYLNLPLLIRRQLSRSGILEENIEGGGLCNATHVDEFYSRRADFKLYGRSQGSIWGVLGLKE